MPNVVKVQSGYKAQPLSAYLRSTAPSPAPAIKFPTVVKEPPPAIVPAINFPKINKGLVKENFFEYLDFALQFAPPEPEEMDIRAKLARIGIGPGEAL